MSSVKKDRGRLTGLLSGTAQGSQWHEPHSFYEGWLGLCDQTAGLKTGQVSFWAA